MSRRSRKRLALAVLSLLLTWIAVEVTLSIFFLQPTPLGSGSLFGRVLPPLRPFNTDSHLRYQQLLHEPSEVEGLTNGDLWGILREDPLLGSVPQESANSANGWWRTNRLGARLSTECEPLSPGQKRIVVVGDSYAEASRVHQDDTWSAQFNRAQSRLQAVNFGVGGYGMAQSYLRYRRVKDQLDHQMAVIFFVPQSDLWRDVNVSRRIGAGWPTNAITPRFELVDGQLQLVASPYPDAAAVVAANSPYLSPKLDLFLQQHEKFYRPELYRPGALGPLQFSVLARWLQLTWGAHSRKTLRKSLYSPNSEAAQVSRAIFEAMAAEVHNDGREFLLVLVPNQIEVAQYRANPRFRKLWDQLTKSVCGDLETVDLMPFFFKAPAESIDRGVDGTHHGPQGNGLIAQALLEHLRNSGQEWKRRSK